ncbi:MAG: hypothetical protein JKY61_02280 [Planctomycetes bacterium]|nr:hypothetical protein [Planctomycetota bacterium]
MMALRFVRGTLGTQRLRRVSISTPDQDWLTMFDGLRKELGIDRAVRLLASGLAEVPMVVGWLSPVVIVPVAAFSSLDPAELRCLLIHELQHIRRNDHLFNAVQTLVEIVLFFHPAVWWMSGQLRIEREYCCDDSAIALTDDPKILAEALASMEALRMTHPNLVLAANGGPLMKRITRILNSPTNQRRSVFTWQVPAALMLTGIVAAANSSLAQSPTPKASPPAHEVFKEQAHLAKRAKELATLKALLIARNLASQSNSPTDEAVHVGLSAAEIDNLLENLKASAEKLDSELKMIVNRTPERSARVKTISEYLAAEKQARQDIAVGLFAQEKADVELAQIGKGRVSSELQAAENVDRMKGALARKQAIIEEIMATLRTSEKSESELTSYLTAIQEFGTENDVERSLFSVDKGYTDFAKRMEAQVNHGMITEVAAAKALVEYASARSQWLSGESALKGLAILDDRQNTLVSKGVLSEQAALGRLSALQKGLNKLLASSEGRREYKAVQKELTALVKHGMITESQAAQRLELLRSQFAGSVVEITPSGTIKQLLAYKPRTSTELAVIKLRAAVKAGEIAEKEAMERLFKLEAELKAKREAEWKKVNRHKKDV